MLPTDPASTSELLRAQHIVATSIETATFGEWERDGEMLVSRRVEARLRLERVLKGELDDPIEPVATTVFREYRNDGPRFVAVPGVWSGQHLEPGAQYVVLSSSSARTFAEVVDESSVFLVLQADAALPDIGAVLAVEQGSPPEPRKPLPRAVVEMSERRGAFTGLVARYVAWRQRELFFGDLDGFDTVLGEAEAPDTSAIFRATVFTEAYDYLLMLDPAPPRFIARLIWKSLRSISDGPGAVLGSRIADMYIPNLVGLEGGAERKAADDVFREDPELGLEVEQILRTRSLPNRDTLLEWLAL